MESGRERIIVALDTPDLGEASRWVERLAGKVGAFKVGLEFLHAAGPAGVRALQAAGAHCIFFDCQFSDIHNMVAGGVRSPCALYPWMSIVHALSGAASMRAAREEAERHASETVVPRPLVIAVTV